MTTELWHKLKNKQAQRLVGGYQRVTGANFHGVHLT